MVPDNRGCHRWGDGLTQKIVPDAAELDAAVELGVAEDLTRHGLLPDLYGVNADALRARVDFDDAGREALGELFGVRGRDGLFGIENNVRE